MSSRTSTRKLTLAEIADVRAYASRSNTPTISKWSSSPTRPIVNS